MDTPQERDAPVIGALLVHGLNGSQRDMTEIEERLSAHGVITVNILLPGHGSHVRDMLSLGWPEWTAAVRRELHLLKQRCDEVFLIGHSLGGALCLHTAAHEEVAGVVSMCAPLHMQPWTRSAVHLAKRVTPLLPTLREDVRDPEARRRYTRDVYRWTPMAPVASMLEYLPHLRQELKPYPRSSEWRSVAKFLRIGASCETRARLDAELGHIK